MYRCLTVIVAALVLPVLAHAQSDVGIAPQPQRQIREPSEAATELGQMLYETRLDLKGRELMGALAGPALLLSPQVNGQTPCDIQLKACKDAALKAANEFQGRIAAYERQKLELALAYTVANTMTESQVQATLLFLKTKEGSGFLRTLAELATPTPISFQGGAIADRIRERLPDPSVHMGDRFLDLTRSLPRRPSTQQPITRK